MKTKTLVLSYGNKDSEKRVTVPDTATVTFGGLIPGAKVDSGSNRTALRIYIGKRQIGVFTGIQEFRFLDEVNVLEKRIKEAQKNVAVEENGVAKQQVVTVRTEEWSNPDEMAQPEEAAKEFNRLRLELK